MAKDVIRREMSPKKGAPLFRSAAGRTGALTDKPMNRVDAWRMIQRRAAVLGTRARIGCHTFRATGITAYLEAGGTLENAAHDNWAKARLKGVKEGLKKPILQWNGWHLEGLSL